MAGATPTMPISPMPFAPIGLTCGSSSATRMTSMARTSACTGTRFSARLMLGVRAERAVEVRLSQQRHADALNDAAVVLAARRLGVEDAAAGEGRHDAAHAGDAEVGIDAHFREDGAEGAR